MYISHQTLCKLENCLLTILLTGTWAGALGLVLYWWLGVYGIVIDGELGQVGFSNGYWCRVLLLGNIDKAKDNILTLIPDKTLSLPLCNGITI